MVFLLAPVIRETKRIDIPSTITPIIWARWAVGNRFMSVHPVYNRIEYRSHQDVIGTSTVYPPCYSQPHRFPNHTHMSSLGLTSFGPRSDTKSSTTRSGGRAYSADKRSPARFRGQTVSKATRSPTKMRSRLLRTSRLYMHPRKNVWQSLVTELL